MSELPPKKSTTVRYRAPWLLRAGFSTLSLLAPPLAVRAAKRLFRTPPRHLPSEQERQALEGARAGFLRVTAGRLATRCWGEGPAVCLVHGWGSRAARLRSFVEPLLRARFSVVAFDAPGHGDSDGTLSSLPQFIEALQAVTRAHGPWRGVVAHSMGGTAAALAMRRGMEVDRAVFIAPAAHPGSFPRRFAQMLGIPAAIRAEMERRLEEELGFRWEDFDVPSAVREFFQPLLVFHDRDDGEVPWSDGEAIARAWPGAELITTEGLGHTKIVHDPGVVRRAVAFLSEETRPLSEEAVAGGTRKAEGLAR